jgi:nucleotide-binding universal stress UspA family protein
MPAQEIVEFAQAQPMDLIVMCSHGDGLTQLIRGSVAQKVVRHSSIPVFVLHEEGLAAIAQPGALARPLRILVGLDGSPFAESVLVPAAQLCAALAAPAQGALHLMRVVPTLSGLRAGQELYDGKEAIDAIYALAFSDARTYLNDMERRLREPDLAPLNLTVTSSVVDRDDVASTLSKAAESGKYIKDEMEGFDGCDIIALATHGRSGLSRLVLGSVTEYLLETTKLPLLIVRPGEQAIYL